MCMYTLSRYTHANGILKVLGTCHHTINEICRFFVLVLIKRKLPVCAAITLYATLVSLCLGVAFWHKVQGLVAKTLFAE